MNSNSKVATIFAAIFRTFLIPVKVRTLLRINYFCIYENIKVLDL